MNQDFNQNMSFNQTNSNEVKVSKKSPIGLIIGIIVAIVVVAAGIIIFNSMSGNDNNGGTGNNDSSNGTSSNSEKITQIKVDYNKVVALTEKGNMYVVQEGEYENYYGEGFAKDIETPKLIKSNVKEFFGDGHTYLDKDNNLYKGGLNIVSGGFYKEYIKLGEGIKTVDSGTLGLIAISNSGDLYVYGHPDYYIGSEKKQALTKIETKAKVIDAELVRGVYFTYLTSEGELYAQKSMPEKVIIKQADNIEKVEDKYITAKDGKIFEVSGSGNVFTLVEMTTQTTTTATSELKDSKELLYSTRKYNNGKESYCYVYLNNKGKIVLYDKTVETTGYDNGMPIQDITENKQELDCTIDNMSKIKDFVKKYQY